MSLFVPGFSRHIRFATGFSRWGGETGTLEPALAGLLLFPRKARLKPAEGERLHRNHQLKLVAKQTTVG